MTATSVATPSSPTATPLRFAAETFDEIMKARGIEGGHAKAAQLGIHRATFYRWRNRKRIRLTLEDALSCARSANIPVDQLFVPATDAA